jgi:hypothetical protein
LERASNNLAVNESAQNILKVERCVLFLSIMGSRIVGFEVLTAFSRPRSCDKAGCFAEHMTSIFRTNSESSNKLAEAGGKLSDIFRIIIEPSLATQKTGLQI